MPRPATRDRCPLCGAAPQPQHRPFCSAGCRDRDLLKWLGEDYRIPGERADPAAETGLDSPHAPD